MEASGAILWTAASLAVVHTLLGVDHALPFVVLAKVRGWSLRHAHALAGLTLAAGGVAVQALGL